MMMLELRNIYKTYLQGKLEVPVLGGISLCVEEGEYVAIMGPSGSGEYYLGDENIAQLSEKRMSDVRLHSIGFVFQSFYLLSRQSALDNVALPLLYAGVRRRERQEIARRALERVGLGDRTDFKPTQLSGGQCQRVAIARAIVNNPKIILADEPTGALDTKSGAQIMEIFQSLNDEGVTIVMITHEPEIAAHAKRVLHIRDGLLLGGAGQPLPQEQAQKQPPVPPPPQPPQPKPVSGTQAPPKAKPAPKPAPAQAGSASEAKKAVPLEQKAPPPPTGKVIPTSQITEPEEPISGASILASLERQLDALKQDSAKGEVSNNES